MTVGLQSLQKHAGRAVYRLLDAANTSAAPTIADTANQQGAPTSGRGCRMGLPGRYRPSTVGLIRLYNTAGSGVVSLSYARLWGWMASDGLWMPVGPGVDADKGKLNVANSYAFGEDASDKILHTEMFLYCGLFDYLTVQLGTASGSATSGAITIDVVAAAKTYTRGSGSFLTDGFAAGMTVTASGFTNGGNNGAHVIDTVSALVMTMTSATGLVNESGGGNEQVVDAAVPLIQVDLVVPVYDGGAQ